MRARDMVFTATLLSLANLAAAQAPKSEGAPTPARTTVPAPKPNRKSPIPDEFTNLQALPKDTGKQELMLVMKTFAITFEKRCSFCHVATDDLSEADFASDEKETKEQARDLIRAIRAAGQAASAQPATPAAQP